MLRKQRGYGLIEAMMVTVMSTVIILGGVKSYQMFSESNELDDRSVITAQQIAQFSEASYLYASQKDDNDGIITVSELNESGFLVDTFPLKTPYGQEIKGFLVENEDSPSLNDILVATTGEPDEAMINKTGQKKESYNKNQMKTYYSIRRELLSIDNSYSMGIIEGNQFATENDLIVRDISRFGATIDTNYKQVGVYMISPEAKSTTSDVVTEIRAIGAYPDENVPANNSAESIISISIRDSNGNPVENSRIEWTKTNGTLSSTVSYTNAEGVATTKIKSGVAGSIRVTGREIDSGDTAYVDVEFEDYEVSSITADQYSDVKAYYVDNSQVSCNYVTGTLQYPDGTPAENILVRWTSTNGEKLYMNGSITKSITSKTNTSGVSQICIKSQDGGDFDIEMEAPNNATGSVTIEFVDFRVISYSFPNGSPQFYEDFYIDVVVGYPNGDTVDRNIIARSYIYDEQYPTNGRQSWGYTNSFGEASLKHNGRYMVNKENTLVLLADGGDRENPPTIDFDLEMPGVIDFYIVTNVSELKVGDAITLRAIVGFNDGKKDTIGTVKFTSPKGGILHGNSEFEYDLAIYDRSEASVGFRADKAGDYRITASMNGISKFVDLHYEDASETRYDANNYVLGESHSCQAITVPSNYSAYWDGNKIWYSQHDYKKDGSFVVGKYRYSWSSVPQDKTESLDPMGAPCASKMGHTYWRYSITREEI